MPQEFTVFNARNRDANVQYNSGVYTVLADTPDTQVQFTLTNLDLVNEPSTTIIYWTIERNDGAGWRHMVSGDLNGMDSVTPPKPPGKIGCGISGIRGQQVRGSLYFVSANDQRKRFGVNGETL